MFDEFQGFNEHRRKKLKAQPMESDRLKSHAEALFSLCTRPMMRSSEPWEVGYEMIKSLAECFAAYSDYLSHQKEKVQENRMLDHPVRQVSENTSVQTVHKSVFQIREQYQLLDKSVCLVDALEPVFFSETDHITQPFENAMQRLRFFNNLQLSVDVDLYKYCPGGGITTVFCLVKVSENRSEAEKMSQVASTMLKIQPKLPEIHTRFMKAQFKRRVANVASVKPSLLDLIYKELTLDSSSASHPDMQQRLRLIFQGETGLIPDLRHINPGRPTGMYDTFFSTLAEVIEEYTAADDRRHNEAHMSQILSLKDLISQTKEKCPENTSIPSASLVRLQFTPRNPYAHTALSFTSKIPVQYKIQQRQLRISHPDDHYCSAQFKYMRNMAVLLGSDCAMYFCDDKAKIPIGEPNLALSTGVRGKKSIAPTNSVLVAADHDLHHKGSLTPSVYMRCEVPDSIEKSFYHGNVTTIINDSVFQQSTPMRHAAAMVKQVKSLEEQPSVILKFSDGGTDHRNTLESVKCSAICLFKELDLDMYIAARCAPGHSWTNPAERVMSLLNIGLQNCALSRQECAEDIEKLLKNCNSMESIREMTKKHPDVKDHWQTSTESVKQIIENRFRRLSLKDKPVEVLDSLNPAEIDYLTRHLNFLFPELDVTKLVKKHTSKVESYITWVDKHCRQRHYSFQIRKCEDANCCTPPKKAYQWLPDPVLDDDQVHYKPFEVVYGTETSEADRPTLQRPPSESSEKPKTKSQTKNPNPLQLDPLVSIIPEDPELKGDASTFTGQNARLTVECKECKKPRVIYSKVKLTDRYKLQIAILCSEYDYTCGSPLTPPEHPLHGKTLVRLNIDCTSPIETGYYSSKMSRGDLCYYCGATESLADENLKKSYITVYPLCDQCKALGFKYCCLRPFGKKSKLLRTGITV